jgi:hypothetical protein
MLFIQQGECYPIYFNFSAVSFSNSHSQDEYFCSFYVAYFFGLHSLFSQSSVSLYLVSILVLLIYHSLVFQFLQLLWFVFLQGSWEFFRAWADHGSNNRDEHPLMKMRATRNQHTTHPLMKGSDSGPVGHILLTWMCWGLVSTSWSCFPKDKRFPKISFYVLYTLREDGLGA